MGDLSRGDLMSTHNRFIYHCLKCGSVEIREPWEPSPLCCGAVMNQSAAETVEDPPARPAEKVVDHPPDPQAGAKPTESTRPAQAGGSRVPELPATPAEMPDLSVWFD